MKVFIYCIYSSYIEISKDFNYLLCHACFAITTKFLENSLQPYKQASIDFIAGVCKIVNDWRLLKFHFCKLY